jgi:UDP-N-acetylmuramoyl-tripeptide--D-alanyl-D-alanine ligase
MSEFQIIEKLYAAYLKHPLVVTDSRKIEPGCIFFALRGDRFDGNTFARDALDNGAVLAVIDDARFAISESYILVHDVLQTLQALATHHRRQLKVPVIAITGSNGKTTTKELVHAVLASQYRTHCTQGNLNNHIGVPLTLLAMPTDTEIAVIEMGASAQGEIDALSHIAEPTHGLITNIGKAHLEGFGGIEGVKRGKSELYRYLGAHDGLVFVNRDEAHLQELAVRVQHQILYGRSEVAVSRKGHSYGFQHVADMPQVEVVFLSENGQPCHLRSHLPGMHNLQNIMTALAVGLHFGVPSGKIAQAIEGYVPANNRSQILHKGSNRFFLDAYNANPTSMRNALLSFQAMDGAHKIAILGAMLELGEDSDKEHREIAQLALSLGFEAVVLVGKEFEATACAGHCHFFPSTAELTTWLRAQNYHGVFFFVKGSRGIALEQVLGVWG